MPSFRSLAGVVGPTLATTGDAVLKARLNLPKLQDEQEEYALRHTLRPLELEKARQELEYRRALTQKNIAGLKTPVPKVHNLSNGAYAIEYPPTPEEPRGRIEVRSVATNDPQKILQGRVLKIMEQAIGKPMDDWTPEDIGRPEVQSLLDTFRGRSDVTVVPGVGPYKTETIRGALQGQQPVQASPGTPLPTAPGRSDPRQTAPPRTQVQTAPTSPLLAQKWEQRFASMPQEEAKAELEQLTAADRGRFGPEFMAATDAYIRRFPSEGGERLRVPAPGTVARPSVTTPAAPATVQQPPQQPTLPSPLKTAEQIEKEGRERTRFDREEQRFQNEHDRLQLEHQRFEAQERRATTAEGRAAAKEKKDSVAAQMRLNATVERATTPYRRQLEAIQTSEELTDVLAKMITPYTTGVWGKARGWLQSLASNLPAYGDKAMQDVQRFADLGRQEAAATGDAQLFRYFDPRMSQIKFYMHAIAYAHAAALRTAGGVVRISEVERARRALEGQDTAPDVMSRLNANKQLLQMRKDQIAKELRATEQRLRTTGGAEGVLPATEETPTVSEDDLDRLEQRYGR